MVRSKTMQRSELNHCLEDGAVGFMIPFVSTAEIVRDVANATQCTPLGNRGVNGADLLVGDYGAAVVVQL
jgi:2-keto-3-deoxy-L-rhamnonate aldolase RhmA